MSTRTTNIVLGEDVRDTDAHRPEDGMLTWLLQGDPAIRWQVLRDLRAGTNEVVHTARQWVAEFGWSARPAGVDRLNGTPPERRARGLQCRT